MPRRRTARNMGDDRRRRDGDRPDGVNDRQPSQRWKPVSVTASSRVAQNSRVPAGHPQLVPWRAVGICRSANPIIRRCRSVCGRRTAGSHDGTVRVVAFWRSLGQDVVASARTAANHRHDSIASHSNSGDAQRSFSYVGRQGSDSRAHYHFSTGLNIAGCQIWCCSWYGSASEADRSHGTRSNTYDIAVAWQRLPPHRRWHGPGRSRYPARFPRRRSAQRPQRGPPRQQRPCRLRRSRGPAWRRRPGRWPVGRPSHLRGVGFGTQLIGLSRAPLGGGADGFDLGFSGGPVGHRLHSLAEPVGDAGDPVDFGAQQAQQLRAGRPGHRHRLLSVSRAGRGPGVERRRSRHAVTLVCPRPSQYSGRRPGSLAGAAGCPQPGYLYVVRAGAGWRCRWPSGPSALFPKDIEFSYALQYVTN